MPVDRDATLKKAEKLLRQGKLAGAIDEYARLVADQPRDWNSVNALGDLYVRAGDTDRAVAQFTAVADHLFGEGFLPRASALYKKALKVKTDHDHTLVRLIEIADRQGLMADAKTYLRELSRYRAGRGDHRGVVDCDVRLASLPDADPESKVIAARALRTAGEDGQAAAMLVSAADQLIGLNRTAESLDALSEAVGLRSEDAELRGRLIRAGVAAGRLDLVRPHVAADAGDDSPELVALALVEIAVDVGDETVVRAAQAQLADVYLDAGRGVEARVIAEDLVAQEPESRAHADRLRRAFDLLGLAPAVEPEPAAVDLDDLEPERATESEALEIDLSATLAALRAQALVLPPMPVVMIGDTGKKDLETIFDALRSGVAREHQVRATEHYERGIRNLDRGRLVDAIGDLQAAARTPILRFKAAASLGRVLASRGEWRDAVDWLERAAEAPPRTEEEGRALLYDLADALEHIGESTRALAVFVELEAEAPAYRDVRERATRLSQAKQGSASA